MWSLRVGSLQGFTATKRTKLAEAVQKSWRRLNGHNQLPKPIHRAKFAE
jgi:hypothetical protein